MAELNELVRRLSKITDELISLRSDEYSRRYALESERDELRIAAQRFRERKDEQRTIHELDSELLTRREQLETMKKLKINMLFQTQNAHGYAMVTTDGDTVNSALMRSLGADEMTERITEIEQELTSRGLDPRRRR